MISKRKQGAGEGDGEGEGEGEGAVASTVFQPGTDQKMEKENPHI